MTFLAVLATIAGIVMGCAGVPQVIKIFQRKSARDIAVTTYLILVVGGCVWLLYGIEISSFPIVISNIIGITINCIVLYGWHLYGKER